MKKTITKEVKNKLQKILALADNLAGVTGYIFYALVFAEIILRILEAIIKYLL